MSFEVEGYSGYIANPEKHNIRILAKDNDTGEKFEFCILCVRPHVFQYCDGTKERRYWRCEIHMKEPANAKILENERLLHERIRGMMTDEMLAYPLAVQSRYAFDKLQRESPEKVDEHFKGYVDKMLKPTKEHRGRCLFSGEAEVVIVQGRGGVGEVGGMRQAGVIEVGCNGGLDTGLAFEMFFRRCDGVYRNAVGKMLERG